MPKIDKSSLFSQISGKKLTINIVSSLLPLILKPGPTQINIKNGHDEKSNFSTKAFRQTRIRSFIIWSEQILAFPWIKLLDIFLAFALIFIGLTALCFPAIGLLVLVFMLPPLLKREDSPESADKRRVQLSS
jgi:hypothetical protein